VAAGHEDVVEKFLLSASLLLLVLEKLPIAHINQGFVVLVGGLIHLHLRVTLLPEQLQLFDEGLPCVDGRLRCLQHCLQLARWNWLL